MRSFTASLRLRLLASTIAALASQSAFAQTVPLPSGGSVSAGSATIDSQGAAMSIRQNSGRAVIGWNSFSIGTGGSVNVVQPGTASALLNRVTGNDVSRIAGTLTSNGQLFLVNRNGILVDQNGKIDAHGGFVGSTLDISNDDFMAGKLGFSGGGTGSIVNRGTIAGGAVALLGSSVSNLGTIVSPLGRVAIGAASQATLDLNGDGLLQVAIPSEYGGTDGAPLINQSGLIDVGGGIVVMRAATARDIVRQTINMAGIIRATSVSRDGGTVVLDGGDGSVAVSGTIDASGANGGRIDISGGDVALTGARVLATGGERGGVVRVGGAFQGGAAASATTTAVAARFGGGAPLQAARTTTLDATSIIDASGAAAGGAVVLWSEDRTRQLGLVNASGVTGGAIELSSKGALTTNLSRVRSGRGGTLLLDPKNIQVLNSYEFGAGFTADPLTTGTVGYGDNPGATSIFNVLDIKALMEGGTDVILRASNDINWAANLGLSFDAGVGDLALSAGRSVNLSGFITLNQASLSVIANDTLANGVVDADRDPGAGDITAFDATISGGTASGWSGGHISLAIGSGAGLTNGAAGDMRLASIVGRSITIDAGSRTVSLFDYGSNPPGLNAVDALSLTGALKIQASDFTLSGRSVTWHNEASAALTAATPNAVLRFVENGVQTRYGVLQATEGQSGDTTRLALGNGATAPAYSAIYGDAYGSFDALHLVSGALQGGDTLGTILGANATATTSLAAGLGVGDYAVTTSAASGFGLASGVSGYFVDLRSVSDTLRITPKTLSASVAAGAYTYGAPASVATLNGVIGSDAVDLAATVSGLGTQALSGSAGTYAFAANLAAGQRSFTLTGLGGAAAANYTLDLSGTISAALAIDPKLLAAIGTSTTSTYGTLNGAVFNLSGILFGDDVAVAVAGISRNGVTSTLSATTGVGTYATIASALTGSAAGNYALDAATSSAGSAIIDPKSLTYATATVNTVYGTLAALGAPTLSGVIAGDDVAAVAALNHGAVTLGARTAAGSYNINAALTGSGVGNYLLSDFGSSIGTLAIARLALGVVVANASQVYSTPVALATLTGALDGDDVNPVGTLDNSFNGIEPLANNAVGFRLPDVGTHSFRLSGLGGSAASNYFLDLSTSRSATLIVTPKPLSYSINSLISTYGAVLGAITLNIIDQPSFPLTAPILVTNIATGVTVALADIGRVGAGRYALTPGALSGANAFNYMIAPSGNVEGALTVNPKTIFYTGLSASTTYGSAIANPGAVLSGAFFNDDVTANVSILSGSTAILLGERTAAGRYDVAVTSLGGAAAGNYILGGGTNGQVTIDPKTITYAIGSSVSTYGQQATLNVTLNGVLAGDVVTPTYWAQGTSPVRTRETLTNRVDVGTYALGITSLGGSAGSNYLLAATGNVAGLLSVTPATLTFNIAAATSVFGDPLAYAPIAWSGLVAGDALPISTVRIPGSEFTANVGAGTYTPDVNFIASSNYIVSRLGSSIGAYTVTPRPITLTVIPAHGSGGSALYGVLPSAVTGTALFSNVVGANDLGATVTAQGITTSAGGFVNAGSYALTAGALTGNSALNYVLASTTNSVFTVRPLALSQVGQSVLNSIYGAPPVLAGGAVNALAGDQVTFAGLHLTQNGNLVNLGPNTGVGFYYIQADSVTGADVRNYTFDPAQIVGSLQIAPRALTYATGNLASTYGTLASVEGLSVLSGIVGSDDVRGVVAGPSFLSATTNVGKYMLDTIGLIGSAVGNYFIARDGSTTGVLTINPRSLTFSYRAPPADWTYGVTQAAASFIDLNGLIGNDEVKVNTMAILTGAAPGNPLYIGDAFAIDSLLNAGSYRVALTNQFVTLPVLSGAGAGNYSLAANAATNAPSVFTVTPRAIAGAMTVAGTATYGDTPRVGVTFDNFVGTTAPQYALTATLGSASRALGQAAALPANLGVGTHTINLALAGLDSYNYALAGAVSGQIAISPLAVSLTALNNYVTYATQSGALVGISGLLAGDDVAPLISIAGGAATRMTSLADGFGIGVVNRDVGIHNTSIAALTGTAAGNYQFTGFDMPLVIRPKTITYTSAGFAAQYGGLTLPLCSIGCELSGRDNLLQMGDVTFNGILAEDRGLLQGTTYLSLDGRTGSVQYGRTTAPGTYLQIVGGLTGSKADNYVLANEGNTAGLVFILPGWVQANAQDGGRLYTNIAKGTYITLGSPGSVITSRSALLTAAQGTNGFVQRDDVSVIVALTTLNGVPVDGRSILPIGKYRLTPVGLAGAQAANYRLVPEGPVYGFYGSHSGVLSVADSSVFNFSFLGTNPNAVYVAPAVVSLPPIAPGSTTTTSTSGTTGTTATAGLTGGVTGTASGGVTTTTTYANGSSMTAGVTGAVGAAATYGPLGVGVTASASGDVSITLSRGPVTIDYGAFLDASGKVEVSLRTLTIGAGGEVMAGAREGVLVSGALGSGMTGSTGLQASVFTSANGETSVSLKNGATLGTSAFVGVGASAGVSGSLSGGGVTGSLTTTVYSPGSLYIGAKAGGTYEDHTLTLGFNLGVSLLIGGLEISPSLSFSTKVFEDFGNGLKDMFVEMGTSAFWTGQPSCDAGCRAGRIEEAKVSALSAAIAPAGGGTTNLAMVQYLAQHPDVVALAAGRTDAASMKINLAMSQFGGIDADLASVVSQQQALATKLAKDPSSLTLADMNLATMLRAQEQSLIAKFTALGAQVVAADGKLAIVAKPGA